MNTLDVVTCEYPPQPGGVSDYCRLIAEGLAAAGQVVRVWCPGQVAAEVPGSVRVVRELGDLGPAALVRMDRLFSNAATGPRRILVQWVPHGYRLGSMNLPFCLWVWNRARRGDRIELMVHEVALPFAGGLRQRFAAAVHRLMIALLLRSASVVWVAIPGWEAMCRPYLLGRRVPFGWLPIPATVPPVADPAATAAIRNRLAPTGFLVGRFGNHGLAVDRLLADAIPRLLADRADAAVLLIGGGSDRFCEQLLTARPELAGRVTATGRLPLAEVSLHLAACDVLLQPIPEGVTSRNTSVMAGLAHGKAVVTTPARITESVWAETGAVCLSAAGTQELAAAVGHLLDDSIRRARIAAAGAELYSAQFALPRTLARLAGTTTCDEPVSEAFDPSSGHTRCPERSGHLSEPGPSICSSSTTPNWNTTRNGAPVSADA